MLLPFAEYELQDEQNKKEWQDIKDNTYKHMRIFYKNKISINRILSRFKKVFKVIPITLKKSSKPEIIQLRKFALFLIVHYSNAKFNIISEEFNISIVDLENIKIDISLHQFYEKKTNQFFDYFKSDYLCNTYGGIAFKDRLNNLSDKELREISELLSDIKLR